MRIAVVRAGAVGGYYGTHLALVREEDIKRAIGDKQALASCIYVTHNQRRLCAWLVPLSRNPKRLLGFSQFHRFLGQLGGKSRRPRRPAPVLPVLLTVVSNSARQRSWGCDRRWRFLDVYAF
jgi:hypothetical protein